MGTAKSSAVVTQSALSPVEGESRVAASIDKWRFRPRHIAWSVLGIAVLLTLIAAGVYIAHFQFPRHQAIVPAPISIDSVAVKTGNVSQTVDAPGKLTLLHYADVGTQISGQVKEISINVGDTVKAGTELAEIALAPDAEKIASNRAQLAKLEAELADQNAHLDFSRLQFQRQTRLMQDNATRQENVEASRMNMLSSAAKVDAINAQIQQLNADMKEQEAIRLQTKVIAPMAGTIVAVSTHIGQMVSANQSTLLRIADLGKLLVQARVAENDVTKLHKGMLARFTTPGLLDKHWFGKLTQIMPLPIDDSAQQGKQSFYTVLFEVVNQNRELMVGMNVAVEFVLVEVDNVVTIPSCLVPDSIQTGPFALGVLEKGGKLGRRQVTIGLMNPRVTEVTSGLQAGERVTSLDRSRMSKCLAIENNAIVK